MLSKRINLEHRTELKNEQTYHGRRYCNPLDSTDGWIVHYVIGITFAVVFVALVGNSWLQHPTLIPAILFGVVTVLMPFFIMQPAFGFGFAASKMSNPRQARFRSLMSHTAVGVGFTFLHCWSIGCCGYMHKKEFSKSIYYVVHSIDSGVFSTCTAVQNAKSLKTEVTKGDAL